MGIRDLHLKTERDWPLVLKDFRYVSNLHLNLVSALKLDYVGDNMNLGGEKLKLSRDSAISI